MVGNYYKTGPSTKSKKSWFVNPWSPYGAFFILDNIMYGDELITKDNKVGVKADHPDSAFVSKMFNVESVNTQTASEAYEFVLKKAGASYKRDAIDARIVEEVKTGNSNKGKSQNGIIDSQTDVGGWPELKSTPAPADADQDGMPDKWERSNKLNPNDPADAAAFTVSKSYSNIEVFINNLTKAQPK